MLSPVMMCGASHLQLADHGQQQLCVVFIEGTAAAWRGAHTHIHAAAAWGTGGALTGVCIDVNIQWEDRKHRDGTGTALRDNMRQGQCMTP